MLKNLKTILEEIQDEINEADFPPQKDSAPMNAPSSDDLEDDDDENAEPEPSSEDLPDGKGHYTADDLREIVDYVKELIEKEQEEDGDDTSADSADGEKKEKDDVGEVGLDLIYEYADLFPETVINQIIDDLKDMFEIEDTMLESIIAEGSAFFSRSKKGPAAKAASRVMRAMYRKNKVSLKKRNKKWRTSPIAQKMIALHKKVFSGLGKIHGKRVVHQL